MNYQNNNSKIKVSYQNETHKIPLPDSLQFLKDVIARIFLASLPHHWELVYQKSSNNQQIALHSEQDFQDFKANEPHDVSKNLHAFIRERQNILEIKHDPLGISEYQVIGGESVEINLHQHVLNYIEKPNFISEKSETDLKKLIDNSQQELGLNSNIGLQNHFSEFQKKLEDIANIGKVLEPKSIVSQLSKESVKSEFVINSHIHAHKPSVIKQQPPQPKPQSQPHQKAAEGQPVANLLISESTFEAMFQKMIKKNIGSIASMTAKILQNGEAQPQASFIHENTTCFECGVSPIIGIMYKCLVCADYEVCKDCEATNDHVHALMKIKHQGQQYKPLQDEPEQQDEYSKPMSMVNSEYFEVPIQQGVNPDQDEEVKSSVSQKSQGIIKKSEKLVHESEVLEVIREESNFESQQVVEEEQKEENIEEKEEEKPAEVQQDALLISAEFKQVYSAEVIEKAKQLQQLLPEASLERLFEFVNDSPSKLDVVELMEKFQL